MNAPRLFRASCIALVATAMSFAIRGDIMGDFESVFSLSKTQVGWIAGAAFWGFGLSILFGGPLCDLLGMSRLARLAAIGHIGGTIFGQTTTAPMWFVAAALLAIGTAFWWPTMLGITTERFPRGGALLLAIIGASGAFSTAIAGPVMGWINDTYGARAVLPIWAILPVALYAVFALIFLSDRARGGYRVERIQHS